MYGVISKKLWRENRNLGLKRGTNMERIDEKSMESMEDKTDKKPRK